MADQDFAIAATLTVDGHESAAKGLRGVAREAAVAERQFHAAADTVSGLGGTLSSLADAGASWATHGLLAAVGGAVAAMAATVKVGLLGVNAQLEGSTLSMGTVFKSIGAVGDMGEGLERAQEVIAGIRKDAAMLPGEFGEFVSMAQMISAPLLQAGARIEDIRTNVANLVVTGKTRGMPLDQAAREYNQLIDGRAGGHNVLGMRMGINAHTRIKGATGALVEFNKATRQDRLAFLNAEMGKSAAALPYFQRSWEGLTTTMTDAFKTFAGDSTKGLFGSLKTDMSDVLGWYDKHHAAVDLLANTVNRKLVSAHDRLRNVMVGLVGDGTRLEHGWYQFSSSVEQGAHQIYSAVMQLEPVFRWLGTVALDQLQHPQKLLHEYLALKGIGAALQAAPNAMLMSHAASQWLKPAAAAAGSAAPIAAGAQAAAGAEKSIWAWQSSGPGIRWGVQKSLLAEATAATGAAETAALGAAETAAAAGGAAAATATELGAAATAGSAAVAASAAGTSALGMAASAALPAAAALAAAAGVYRIATSRVESAPRDPRFTTTESVGEGPWTKEQTIQYGRNEMFGLGSGPVDVRPTLENGWTSSYGMWGGGVSSNALSDTFQTIGKETINDKMYGMFANLTAIGENLVTTGQGLWDAITPLVDLVGMLLIGAFNDLLLIVRGLTGALEQTTNWLRDQFTVKDTLGAPDAAPIDKSTGSMDTSTFWQSMAGGYAPLEKPKVETKVQKPPNIDMRGSKVEIKIDAKDQDPDRIVRRMFAAIQEEVTAPKLLRTAF